MPRFFTYLTILLILIAQNALTSPAAGKSLAKSPAVAPAIALRGILLSNPNKALLEIDGRLFVSRQGATIRRPGGVIRVSTINTREQSVLLHDGMGRPVLLSVKPARPPITEEGMQLDAPITLRVYDGIRVGMDYLDVLNRVKRGSDQERRSGNSVQYRWRNRDGSSMSLTVTHGRVAGKTQAGLR